MVDNAKAFERIRLGSDKFPEFKDAPNLIEIQLDGYKDFLQLDKVLSGEDPDPKFGLEKLFRKYFPIVSQDGSLVLDYKGYFIDPMDIYTMKSETECKRRGLSYSIPVKVKISLEKKDGEIQEKDIFFGDFPLMTERGTFIINGAERVVVSSIVRSPGIILGPLKTAGAKKIDKAFYGADLYPNLGSKLAIILERSTSFDSGLPSEGKSSKINSRTNNIISVISPRGEGTKSFNNFTIPVTFLMRIMGLEKRDDIVSTFYDGEIIDTDSYSGSFPRFLYKDVVVNDTVMYTAGQEVETLELSALHDCGINEVEVVDTKETNLDDSVDMAVLRTLKEEILYTYAAYIGESEKRTFSYKKVDYDEALKIYKEEGEEFKKLYISYVDEKWKTFVPQNIRAQVEDGSENVIGYIRSYFSDKNRFDFSYVGRYKLNKKYFGNDEGKYLDEENSSLTLTDVIESTRLLIKLTSGKILPDDQDSLGNRRIRTSRELLENTLNDSFNKVVKAAREKMGIATDDVKPQDLLGIKPIVASIREFFGASQLSQFMDQVNPIAELSQKRRISAIGPKGGIKRENARQLFDVRNVNYTHYGKICPIETPEGGNIGLILTLANYGRINKHGFIETPYRKVVDGKVENKVEYLDAIGEEKTIIAQGNAEVKDDGNGEFEFVKDKVSVRDNKNLDYITIEKNKVDYMDVSPKQVVSTAASLIPFLEHDDANRALMGSNMQRQAVPLLFPETPRVGTGMEKRSAYDSCIMVKARRAGVVTYVSSTTIKVRPDERESEDELDYYELRKFEASNADTCSNQRPLTNVGDRVKEGDILADGPSTDHGELALGRNMLVGFVPWNGYNYEDAVLISERVVSEDIYTSIHISEYEIERRETKLGEEVFTSDLPSVNDKATSHLDADGIVAIGTKVKSGDILVGKVTPKSESENTPEQKLLNSIFGEKSKDTKNASLIVPHGVEGVVIDIQRVTKKEELPAGALEMVKVYIATKRKLKQGDKMAGRHGNKGVVSRVLPIEDMPYMEDGTPLDICLNPLGVPSRMNIGQLMETELGWAAVENDEWYETPVFQSPDMDEIESKMKKAGLPLDSKVTLYDGRTGVPFVNKVFCGYIYYLKLHHLVDDKMHARSTGPYSLVTQQPLGGKANFGGQRLGEMEVWAFEAYGAANNLQELITVKSDDMTGRTNIYQAIVKGEAAETNEDLPEGFKILCQELRGLALDLGAYDSNGNLIPLTVKKNEKTHLYEKKKGR